MTIYKLALEVIAKYILILGQIEAQTRGKVIFWRFGNQKWLLIGKGIIQPEGVSNWCVELTHDSIVLFDTSGVLVAYIKNCSILLPEKYGEIFVEAIQSLHEIVKFYDL